MATIQGIQPFLEVNYFDIDDGKVATELYFERGLRPIIRGDKAKAVRKEIKDLKANLLFDTWDNWQQFKAETVAAAPPQPEVAATTETGSKGT
jgi:hypothetical protein